VNHGYVTTWRCRACDVDWKDAAGACWACGQAGEVLSPFSLTNPTGPKPEAVGVPLTL